MAKCRVLSCQCSLQTKNLCQQIFALIEYLLPHYPHVLFSRPKLTMQNYKHFKFSNNLPLTFVTFYVSLFLFVNDLNCFHNLLMQSLRCLFIKYLVRIFTFRMGHLNCLHIFIFVSVMVSAVKKLHCGICTRVQVHPKQKINLQIRDYWPIRIKY